MLFELNNLFLSNQTVNYSGEMIKLFGKSSNRVELNEKLVYLD